MERGRGERVEGREKRGSERMSYYPTLKLVCVTNRVILTNELISKFRNFGTKNVAHISLKDASHNDQASPSPSP